MTFQRALILKYQIRMSCYCVSDTVRWRAIILKSDWSVEINFLLLRLTIFSLKYSLQAIVF